MPCLSLMVAVLDFGLWWGAAVFVLLGVGSVGLGHVEVLLNTLVALSVNIFSV